MFKSIQLVTQARPLLSRRAFLINQRCNFHQTPLSLISAVSAAITKDHRELEEYYKNIINAPDNDQAERWQNQFTWELARHSIAEELVVYPAFEKNLGDKGKEMADKDRDQHQVVSRPKKYPLHKSSWFSILINILDRSKKSSRSSSHLSPEHQTLFQRSRVSCKI